ncbi:MAG: STAS domain-containing protein [Candidatus Poribacteria bacterium]|nr:STAS domain-containing protein [Candidatus Poribacteria bacterium]
MTTHIRFRDGVTIVEPSGQIVGANVPELREIILPHIAADDEPRILINFEHVKRMSSSGLGLLMQARSLAKHKKGRMGVIHVGKHIKNLLVLSRLSSLFEHFDSEAAAIATLSEWHRNFNTRQTQTRFGVS